MTSVLVWILVAYASSESGVIYSPPVQDLPSCQRMQATLKGTYGEDHARCVQINLMVTK